MIQIIHILQHDRAFAGSLHRGKPCVSYFILLSNNLARKVHRYITNHDAADEKDGFLRSNIVIDTAKKAGFYGSCFLWAI
jgi:hypothetical protein